MIRLARLANLLGVAGLLWAGWTILPKTASEPAGLLPPPSRKWVPMLGEVEPFCDFDKPEWRRAQVIAGVEIADEPVCRPDNPFAVAALVQGTNNVPLQVLMETNLARDAVVKSDDRDGDGDPDLIQIKLEVAELNGSSPSGDFLIPQFAIAPGIRPPFWLFVPKTRGMATVDAVNLTARPELRPPSPPIRVEEGDEVWVILENTHYFPHTIHFHGVDHPYRFDGVPLTSEKPVMPGERRTYKLKPRRAGTFLYHCHVQTDKHFLLGLQGLFIVEENRPDNWLQTLNLGAGKVRHPSRAVRERFDQEYDLHFQSVDRERVAPIQEFTDPRLIARAMNRLYDSTDGHEDYFLLNGKSFPYTLRDSLIVVEPNQRIKLRLLNGRPEPVALHIHGHKALITHVDGVPLPQPIQRDVYELAPAQRLDLTLTTRDDGLNSFGQGVWLLHDHAERAITTDGVGPGGDISMLVYRSFLDENGWPRLEGMNLEPLFTAGYWRKAIPVWARTASWELFSDPFPTFPNPIRLVLAGLLFGLALGWSWLLARVGRS